MVFLFDVWLYSVVLNLIGTAVAVIVLLCKRHAKKKAKNVTPQVCVETSQPVWSTDCPAASAPLNLQQTVSVQPQEKAPKERSKAGKVIWFVCGALAFIFMITVTIIVLCKTADRIAVLKAEYESFGKSDAYYEGLIRAQRSNLLFVIVVLIAVLNLLALWIVFARRMFASPVNFLSGVFLALATLQATTGMFSIRYFTRNGFMSITFYFFLYAIIILSVVDDKKKKPNESKGANGKEGVKLTQPILPTGCLAPPEPQPAQQPISSQQLAQPLYQPAKRSKEPSETAKAFCLIGYICGLLGCVIMLAVGIMAICENGSQYILLKGQSPSYDLQSAGVSLVWTLGFFTVLLNLFVLWIVLGRRLSVMDAQFASIPFFLSALAILMFVEKNYMTALIIWCVVFFPYAITLIVCSCEKKKNR